MALVQDSEPTNHISATLKLELNFFLPKPLMTIKQGSVNFFINSRKSVLKLG